MHACIRWKSRTEVPELVDKYLGGDLPIDHYVTHTFEGVDKARCVGVLLLLL